MASFNPYHKWLGIPLDEQPPSHYRLLGIGELESDTDVIRDAAEQRFIFLRQFQLGLNAELAEQLLNEVSEARVCLFDPQAKSAYDRQLRATLEPAVEDDSLAFTAEELAPVARQAAAAYIPRRQQENTPFWKEPWAIPAATGGMVVLLLLIMLLSSGGDESKPMEEQKRSTTANVDQKPIVPSKNPDAEQRERLAAQQEEWRQVRKSYAVGKQEEVRRNAEAKRRADQEVAANVIITIKPPHRLVFSAAFSPDGERIVSGGLDNTVKVWNSRTGQELLALKGHTSDVYNVAFSPDGNRIVSGSKDNTLIIWDANNGKELQTLEGHTDGVLSVAFSPDGKRIVSGSIDQTLKVWDVATRQELLAILAGVSILQAAFSPDGKRLVSGGFRSLKVWDAETGQEIVTLTGTIRPYDDKRVKTGYFGSGIVGGFSPDGQRIVSSGYRSTIKVWDAVTGQEIRSLSGHKSREGRQLRLTGLSFSPDGKWIVSGGQERIGDTQISQIKLWDTESGVELFSYEAKNLPNRFKGGVRCVAFSPDGKRIVSGHDDSTIKIWDISSLKP